MKYFKTMIIADVGPDHAVIHFAKSVIQETADDQKAIEEIDAVIAGFDLRRIVLSFAGMEMLSSSFLGKMIALRQRLEDQGVDLRVCDMAQHVGAAFRMLNLHKLIEVYPTVKDALD